MFCSQFETSLASIPWTNARRLCLGIDRVTTRSKKRSKSVVDDIKAMFEEADIEMADAISERLLSQQKSTEILYF